MRRGRRSVQLAAALVVLTVALAGLPVAAAGPPDRALGRAGGGVTAALWSWLTAKLPMRLVQLACDQSSQIDPNGGCHAGATTAGDPPPVDPDQSWHIDPNG